MKKKSLFKLTVAIIMLTLNVIVQAIYPIEYLKKEEKETIGSTEETLSLAYSDDYEDEQEMIDNEDIPIILNLLETLLEYEDSLLEIKLENKQNVYIVGDLHGNMHALNIINYIVSSHPNDKFIFLGDYVDRYYNGAEVFLYLASLKIKNPEKIYLLRGNHETRLMNKRCGFYEELNDKFENVDEIHEAFNKVFDKLPIAAVVDCKTLKLFCVHGGICPSGKEDNILSIEQLKHIPKQEPERYNHIMNGLLWSDPMNIYSYFLANENRGIGCKYGRTAVKKFLEKNKLDYIIRAHEFAENGIEDHFNGIVKTVFSIPGYDDELKSTGAVLGFNSNTNMFETIKYK